KYKTPAKLNPGVADAGYSPASTPKQPYWATRGINKSDFGISAILFMAIFLAYALTPKAIPVEDQPNLEEIIPKQFGNWKVDPGLVPILPSPDQQLVNRAYVDTHGRRIMLSIAYGSRQNQNLKAHRQEICYAAQGFQIENLQHVPVEVGGTEITVTRMFATAGQRQEPVTYWFTVGNQVVQSRIERFIVQMRYGLSGIIPDGVLVRISNLNSNEQVAYQEHLNFINEMLSNIPEASRVRFIGAIH
ncbi:MAG TPA: EpsI family protein, partial [Bellilinea sp.]|nr:EpsI family protein [Bellilinea sp.]